MAHDWETISGRLEEIILEETQVRTGQLLG